MSQRDLVAELRAAHVEAPPEVRERVRLIAAGAPAPPRRITWRRALVIAVPLAAAIAATVVFTRPSHQATVVPDISAGAVRTATPPAATQPQAELKALAVPSPRTRAQIYGATLGLRVDKARDISDAVKRALLITTSLGGYSTKVVAHTAGATGSADLTLKVPRTHVQQAIMRLSQLGTITDENVSTVDRGALLNSNDREIARLQRQVAELRAQPPTPATDKRIAALVARIQALQRGQAAIRRAAHWATIDVHVATPLVTVQKKHGHGPLHGVGVVLTWLGIGAVYALAIGVPVGLVLGLAWLAVRILRRRRVDALLSR